MGSDTHYQIYETYYQKAVEAENAGKLKDAKRLYICASESLLKSARQTTGEMKAALIRRADKIQALADLIELDDEKKDEPVSTSMKGENRPEARPEEAHVWKSSGKPNVHFSDIAGLDDVKDSIFHRIILPRKHPEIYEIFKRKVSGGILLYGPPGTGKTMIAKAIACEVDADFYSVRCSDIVGKYFGESEKNIRLLFETARKAEGQSVIFFDEFEALAAHRGGDSPVMNRLVPELLSQMDGFETKEANNILFLAATNRPWDIDSAFLRPPRLTEKIYVGLPDDQARLFLIEHAFKDVPVESSVEFSAIVSCTEGYNAADVVAFCEAMKDFAIDRSIAAETTSAVTAGDLTKARQKVRSSVQQIDLEMLAKWDAQNTASH